MTNYTSSDESSLQGPRMQIHEVIKCDPYEGDVGEGLVFKTNRGDVRSIFHESSNAHKSVIWVCGASGGFRGPAKGLYSGQSLTPGPGRTNSVSPEPKALVADISIFGMIPPEASFSIIRETSPWVLLGSEN